MSKSTSTKPAAATKPAPATSTVNVLAQAAGTTAAPAAGKVAAAAKLAACVASGTAAAGATALAHTWGQGGASVGNVGRLPAGSVTITAKGEKYQPKPGYNATAWQAITQAVTKAGKAGASAATLAQAVGHGGAANVRYHVAAGRLQVTA